MIGALRSLGGYREFATAAVITVALAVGGASTAFAVVYGALFRPPPHPEPERLVRLWVAWAHLPSPDGERRHPCRAVAGVACLVRQRRAAADDPLDALRAD